MTANKTLSPAPEKPETKEVLEKTPEEVLSLAIIRHSFEAKTGPRPLARKYLADLDQLGFKIVPK